MDPHSYSRTIDRQDIERLIGFLDAVDAPHEDLEDEIGDTGTWYLQDRTPPRVLVSPEGITWTRAFKATIP